MTNTGWLVWGPPPVLKDSTTNDKQKPPGTLETNRGGEITRPLSQQRTRWERLHFETNTLIHAPSKG